MKRNNSYVPCISTALLLSSLLSLGSPVFADPEPLVSVEQMEIATESGFRYLPASFSPGVIGSALTKDGGEVLLPAANEAGYWRGKVTSIDTTTSTDGTVVYHGKVLNPEYKEWTGEFVYAHTKGSYPYLYVNGPAGAYEVQYSQDLNNGYVLKVPTLVHAPGRTDYEPEELDEIMRALNLRPGDFSSVRENTETTAKSAPSAPAARSSCNVKVGVGYTSAAKARNGSIASSINSWMSNLNTMIDEVGVTCNFTLGGTKQISITESTNIVTDLVAVESSSQVANWKNNTINADIFVLITSNAAPHNDAIHGVARQNGQSACKTSYEPNAKCGQHSVVRDDYAYSIRVFAHEILHLAGAKHSYAYGQTGSIAYGGNGFGMKNNNSERIVTGNGVRSTTVMSNPPANLMCSNSSTIINMSCGQRLPFISSQTKLRNVYIFPDFDPWSYRASYFPGFYPAHRNAYGQSTPSMKTVIQNGMNILKTNQ